MAQLMEPNSTGSAPLCETTPGRLHPLWEGPSPEQEGQGPVGGSPEEAMNIIREIPPGKAEIIRIAHS